MAGKKTRFVAYVDGQARELFGVSEGGTLELTFRGADNHFRETPGGPVGSPQVTNRISIHRSDNSALSGTTIVRTLTTGDGVTERSSAFIKNSKKNLIWHVYSSLCPDLSHDRYERSTSRTNRIEILAHDVPKTSCLIYHIFVYGTQRDRVELINCQSNDAKFKNFRIVVYSNFLNMPSSYISVGAILPTSSPRIDGIPIHEPEHFGGSYPDGAISLRDDEIYRIVSTLNQRLFIQYIDILVSKMPENESFLQSFKPYFSRRPLQIDRSFMVVDDAPPPWRPVDQNLE